ncbi:MAG TPA: 50S ribosomal protein L19 [Patescibacteria group bacterium]|nr:50S ribosomal protein L19 [Patescibacteria group bacterium]
MALFAKYKDSPQFGTGDKIRITQRIKEGGKERTQAFEGMVIAIKGGGISKTFTVRKIGVHQIGIERIFQIMSPNIEKIEVIKSGVKGVKSAKLYYTRIKPKKEIDKIYARAARKDKPVILSSKRKSEVKKAKKTSKTLSR